MKCFTTELLSHPNGAPYMKRYIIFSCYWFCIYVHHFLSSDWARDTHTHPRHFYSFRLWGGYYEEIVLAWFSYISQRAFKCIIRFDRTRTFFNHIRPTTAHRIVDPLPNTWTLCLGGPRWYDWGFMVPGEPEWKYVPHAEYIKEHYGHPAQ